MAKPALEVSDLSVSYGKTSALWDVDFAIPEGKLVGIVGPNGGGKSTLIKTAMGLIQPLSGSVRFFGHSYKRVCKRVGYVPQRETVDWDFPITVLELVLMGLYGQMGPFRRVGKVHREKAMHYLDMVGMAPFHDRQISQLSGGQQQRAFIARALIQEADLYFMDEPFAGVDVATEEVITERLGELRDQGKTLFVVQHDLHSVETNFDWVVLINMRLVGYGPIEEVFTAENLELTYGQHSLLFTEATKLAQDKTSGLA